MSSTEIAVAYLRTRYRLAVFVPVAVLVVAVGCIAEGAMPSIANACLGVATVWLAMLALRVMDDLADRDADRVREPARISVDPRAGRPLAAVEIGAAVGSMLLAAASNSAALRLTLLVGLFVAYAVWYRVRPRGNSAMLLNSHVVLLKYPLLAVAASPAPDQLSAIHAFAALGVLYLGLCIHETVGDARIRRARGAGPVLVLEVALLAAIPLFTLTR
jgi:4-hydroxybenzoate polyprenyltransferase